MVAGGFDHCQRPHPQQHKISDEASIIASGMTLPSARSTAHCFSPQMVWNKFRPRKIADEQVSQIVQGVQGGNAAAQVAVGGLASHLADNKRNSLHTRTIELGDIESRTVLKRCMAPHTSSGGQHSTSTWQFSWWLCHTENVGP